MKKLILNLFLWLVLFTNNLTAQQAGTLDHSFDSYGYITMITGSNVWNLTYGLAVQPDGKVLTFGSKTNFNNHTSSLFVTRHHEDGYIDTSFASSGQLAFLTSTSIYNTGCEVVLQSDGKIVLLAVVDNATTAHYDISVIRLNIDGSFDTTFGIDGKVILDIDSTYDWASAMRIQADGKIVVTGYTSKYESSGYDYFVVRYNTDGTLDTDFGLGGIVVTPIGDHKDYAFDLALHTDGKIIVVGSTMADSSADFAIVRYNSDGSLDNSFASNGILVTSFGVDYNYAESVVIQTDGKIIVSGRKGSFDNKHSIIARFNSDGTLDSNFGNNGSTVFGFGTGNDDASSVVLQPDGKIVTAGFSINSNDMDVSLARFNSNGGIDFSFGTNGKVITDINQESQQANALAIAPDGKIVIAGSSSMGNRDDLFIARYYSGLSLGLIDFAVETPSVLVYPNPIVESAILDYSLSNEVLISIDLKDMQGKTVTQFISNEKRFVGKHQENLSFPDGLAKGTYFITLSTVESEVSVKILKE